MRKQKLSYFEHLVHAKNERLEKSTILGIVEGRRGRGRPCMCWMGEIKVATNLSLPELREAVQDRDVWRNLIMNVTRSRIRLDGTRQ